MNPQSGTHTATETISEHAMQAETTADVLIVGFGKAGKTIAMTRAKAGDRVILVEQSPQMYGGTCINIGCIPTKTLLTDAHKFRESQVTEDGEVATTSAKDAAFTAARTHRDTFIAKLNAVNKQLADNAGVMVIDGRARFTGPKSVVVSGADGAHELTITADTVVINTGSVPVMPPIEGADNPRVVDSTAVQHLPKRPDALAIVGGGPIGLEFATMFAQFGTRVTVLDGADEFLPRYDRDIAQAVLADLEALGVSVILGAKVDKIAGDGPVEVHYSGGRAGSGQATNAEVVATSRVQADYVLMAVGRKPATGDLGLEAAGIELTERGAVAVDDRLRTNVDGVYAAGDVNGGPQFTYVSYDDHRIILDDRWGDSTRSTEGRVIPTTTFLEPLLSQVGLGEGEARQACEAAGHTLDVRVKKVADIPIMPRPKIVGQLQGMAKFLVDRDADRILGATLYCVDSQELINMVALAMRAGVPASVVGDGIYTHPSSSEVFNALLA